MTAPDTDAPPSRSRRGLLVGVAAGLVGGAVSAGATVGVLMSGLVPLGPSPRPSARPAREPVRFAPLSGNFTSNLAGSGRYIQVSLGVSTRGGEPAIDAIRANEIAIRSAIVETLARQSDAAVTEAAGRTRLLLDLRTAINSALTRAGSDAHVAEVFFMSLVVQ
jgi:flagellar FliL protein